MKNGIQWAVRTGFSVRSCVVAAVATLMFFAAGSFDGFAETVPEIPAVAGEEQAEPWQFNVSAYLWGSSIKGKARTGDDIDVGFSDILDKLKFAGMGLASAQKGRFFVFGDVIYLKLEDDLSVTAASADLTMETWITEFAGGYTVYEQESFTIDLFGGARYLSLDIKMDSEVLGIPVPLDLSKSDGVWNGIVGLKGQIDLPKRWFSTYYFDIGTGETERTYQMMGLVGYRFDRVSLVGGYRYLHYDFDATDTFGKILDTLKIQGPVAGVVYRF